ncbi:lipase secretion chaperone [Chitinimonas koreensis]|uniref:lipase secretion chaperone n=1 Tax=Chitinimonas koreensis TaxID=356302 RepID=UPI000417591B|nr:lipase secretion chaperone [Chitinimonas koreensis]QNM96498.1 lipase chaperone [Chitinimonas koreensis]
MRKAVLAAAVAAFGAAALAMTSLGSQPAEPAAAPSPAPAASQVGTEVDGGAQGRGERLLIDAELRRLFDYHLSSQGERSLDAIIALVERDLDARLSPAAAAEAKRLFRRYLDFKRALIALDADPALKGDAPATARARLDAMRKLRRQFFSADEDQALFGWEDRYDDDALARIQLQQDGTLDAREKQRRLAELDAALPPEMLAARQQPVQFIALDQSVQAARAAGADDAAVFRMRAANVGEAAAARLAALDRDEAAWRGRIEQYRQSLAAIRADAALDETARTAAIERLQAAGFSAEERLRLKAYE